ncbi:MAG: DUF177 domain-containing protein [Prevotella sp.]|nr:DUF177 domain-containing protein [Prevotella sp.]
MCGHEIIQIDLEGLNEEIHRFSFELDDTFFAAMAAQSERQAHKGCMVVDIDGSKGTGCYDFTFHAEGTVTLPCDRCLEDMQQPVNADSKLVVKRGERTDDDGDDVLMVDDKQRMVDLSWFVYELVELAIPMQHVHPDGECNPQMLEMLANHMGRREDDNDIDPRWKDLEKLRTTIND